jgi:hypothetical protein
MGSVWTLAPFVLGGIDFSLSELEARFVAFIRAGYPQGVLQSGYRPLLAVLRRRLCDYE